uniref:hypothetical protein n=1 Tax=uncultured Allisonella sp. TaxID=339338 RepID=UPI00280644FB|nr:hypothetical protein [uncultured Allisonella sp.]
MLNLSYILSSIVVAVITAVLTAFLTSRNIKYEITKKHELDYKKELISQKINAVKKLYGLLRQFDTTSVPDGYYGCMIHMDEMNKLLSSLNDFDKELIWFSNEFENRFTDLVNELQSYKQFMLTPDFNLKNKKVWNHKDAFADMVRIDVIKIRILLYKAVLQENDILGIIHDFEERMEKLPYLQDREKYASVWFDGQYAHKSEKRYR